MIKQNLNLKNLAQTNIITFLSRVTSPYIFVYESTLLSFFSINVRFGLIAVFSLLIFSVIKLITL